MPIREALILCDERDAAIAESVRAALMVRGSAATILLCDASAETLGQSAREAMTGAAAIVAVLREGGRGTRLLRAIEDEARGSTAVLPLMAEASPDAAVSARTEARIRTLADTLSARLGGGVPAKKPALWPRVAVAIAAIAILAVVAAIRFWPRAPSSQPDGPPVSVTGMLSNAGWIVTFNLREPASRIEYKREGDPDFISTGDADFNVGWSPGTPQAKPFVTLPDLRGRVPLLVRYTTLEGDPRGPYEVVFDTTAEAVSSIKRVLSSVPEWISFRLFGGRRLCYFTTLVAFKYAIKEIRYGIDADVPDRRVRFVPSDVPGVHSDDQLFIDLPEDAGSVTVEIVFLDGTTAGPKRFAVRY